MATDGLQWLGEGSCLRGQCCAGKRAWHSPRSLQEPLPRVTGAGAGRLCCVSGVPSGRCAHKPRFCGPNLRVFPLRGNRRFPPGSRKVHEPRAAQAQSWPSAVGAGHPVGPTHVTPPLPRLRLRAAAHPRPSPARSATSAAFCSSALGSAPLR